MELYEIPLLPFKRLRKNNVDQAIIPDEEEFSPDVEIPTGCSKRPSSKAAASEEAKAYVVRYVEALSDARTTLAGFSASC